MGKRSLRGLGGHGGLVLLGERQPRLGQAGSFGFNSGCNFKVQLTGFAKGSDAGSRRKRRVKDDATVLYPSNWE